MGRGELRRAAFACALLLHAVVPVHAQEPVSDKLPPKVLDMVSYTLPGAEIVDATRESEGDRECYRITLSDRGGTYDVYASPDGKFVGNIKKELAVKDVPYVLLAALVFGLVGSIVAAGGRMAFRQGWPEKRSILLEWFAGWSAAAVVCVLLMLMVTSVPRGKNPVKIAFASSVLGGISASLVEVVALTTQCFRGRDNASPAWIVAMLVAFVAFLGLSIPFHQYDRHALNRYLKVQALRPTSTERRVP